MKFATYFIFSATLMLGTMYYAYYTYRQFYPTVLFLVSSKVSYIVISNMLFAIALLVARIFKSLFFGQLRDTEIELLVDTAKYTIPETCLALTIFRNEVTPSVIALFGILIFVKLLHKLSKCRVEYIEQLLPMPIRSQLRVYSLLTALSIIDITGTIISILYITNYGRSVLILFGFEFGLLIIYTINLTIRFIIQVLDSRTEAGMASKGLYLMLTDVICEIIKFITYICLFGLIFVYYGIPIHILRDVYMAFISCQRKVISFVKYLQLTRNLDSRFEDATPEELTAAGNCLVCREDLTQGKKLHCGHVFHLDCLRMWLQHQQSCPLCRANISVSDPAPTPAAAVPAGAAAAHANDAPVVVVNNGNVQAEAAAGPAAALQGPQPVPPHRPQQQQQVGVIAPNPVPAAANTRDPAAHTGAAPTTTPASMIFLNQRMEGPLCRQSFGITRPVRSQQRDEEGFPAFFIVEAEPGVVVMSDPMAGAAEVRSINVGTILFITGRVRSGDGASWLRAPDGWLLESDPAQTTATGELLHSVVPLTGPSRSPNRTTVSSSSGTTKVTSVNTNLVPTTDSTVQTNRSYVEALTTPRNVSTINTEERAESDSNSSSSRFYSRSAHRSRLLDIYDQKSKSVEVETDNICSPSKQPTGEKASPRDGHSHRIIPPPFSSMIDNANESDELVITPSGSQSSRQQQYGMVNGSDNDEEIELQFQKLQSLLATSGMIGNKFNHMQDVVSEVIRRNPNTTATCTGNDEELHKPKSQTNTLRRRRHVQDIQSHMQHVARNLAELSESMLHCQQSLASLIQDEVDEDDKSLQKRSNS